MRGKLVKKKYSKSIERIRIIEKQEKERIQRLK